MISYKLGTNLDPTLIDGVIELNKEFEERGRRINEFFGSDRQHAYLTARPEFRLPNVSKEEFEIFVKRCNENGIEFNYTMNSIYPGSKRFLVEHKQEIIDFVKYLEFIGVKRLTLANPILMDMVREASNTIDIEISTIAHIDSITQVKYYKEHYNIGKVCGNLMKNRSVKFLKTMAAYCNRIGVKLELMVNEFCITGGFDYSTHCIFRDSCYLCHSSNITKEDALSLDGFPMSYCMTSRNTHPANWLRARWILPQHIQRYVDIGITNFKITGRTGTTEYLLSMARAYLEQKFDKNLLELWKPLETIYNDQKESEFQHEVYIDATKIGRRFIDHWFENPVFDCADVVCGEDCKFCEEYYNEFLK